jgi:hypothetical protein
MLSVMSADKLRAESDMKLHLPVAELRGSQRAETTSALLKSHVTRLYHSAACDHRRPLNARLRKM